MLPTKKWHIVIEFDWNAWEILTEEHVAYIAADLIPPHVRESLEIKVTEENGE